MLYGYSCFLEYIVGEMLNRKMKIYILSKRRGRLLANRSKLILTSRLSSLDLKYIIIFLLISIVVLKILSLCLSSVD